MYYKMKKAAILSDWSLRNAPWVLTHVLPDLKYL